MNSEKAYHIGCKEGDIGEYVILTGDPKRCKEISANFENPSFISDTREFVTYTGFLSGEKISVVSTGIGGPSTAIAVEECFALGARYFIRVGTCGGISKEVDPGNLVIATAAVRQDGTTKEYAPIEFPCVSDFELTYALKQSAEELGFNYNLGIVQSKDSFYGQHNPGRMATSGDLLYKWEAWKKLGVLASEMECSTVFCVSSFLGAKAACILHCILNQEQEKYEPANKQALDTGNAVKTAILTFEKVIESKKTN